MQNVILSPVAIPELVNLIANELEIRFSKNHVQSSNSPKRLVKGVHAIAKELKISPSRAQKLKNDGIIPYSQNGRLVLFDLDAVLQAMQNVKKR